METLSISAVLGVLAPILVAVITRSHWSSQAKRWAALAVYLVLALLAWVVTRFPDAGAVILGELTMVVAAGQVTYTAVKPTGLLEQVEAWSTPGEGSHASE